MTWHLTRDVAEFRAETGGLLAADPVLCTLVLSVSETVRVAGPHAYDPAGRAAARFGWWRERDTGPATGAFLQTPPRVPLLGPMPARAAAELPDALRRDPSRPVHGVRGPAGLAHAFAGACAPGTGSGVRTDQRLRLFRLADRAMRPRPPEGRARAAVPGELPLLREWFRGFAEWTSSPPPPGSEIERRVDEGLLLVWEVDGLPVSMVGRTPVVLEQAKIAPVYTPAALRGRGYAGAVTAAAGDAALAAGAREVLLFTDLANPTSNALYPRIGYRPVSDFLSLSW